MFICLWFIEPIFRDKPTEELMIEHPAMNNRNREFFMGG